MRVAEAYLTYAEASIRKNGANSKADEYINTLHKRANAKTQNGYTLNDVIKEWSKEFWFEGRRRMDLIRFNSYGGQSDYKWEWMGGAQAGTMIDARFNVFPIPDSELNANPNIKPNYK